MSNVNDKIINTLCKMTGKPRAEVIKVLKQMSAIPEVKQELRKQRRN